MGAVGLPVAESPIMGWFGELLDKFTPAPTLTFTFMGDVDIAAIDADEDDADDEEEEAAEDEDEAPEGTDPMVCASTVLE